MRLVVTENNRFIHRIDFTQKLFHALFVAFADTDASPVEILLFVCLILIEFILARFHDITFVIFVFINGASRFLNAKRRQKSVFNALQKRILVYWSPEILICIGVHIALRRCRKSKLTGARKIFKNLPPSTFILRTPAMTFVNYNEIEEIGRILTIELFTLFAAHERIVNRKENRRVRRHFIAAFVNRLGSDASKRMFIKSAEIYKSLIGENIAIRKKKNARHPFTRLSVTLCSL